jgi:hypothetical protein
MVAHGGMFSVAHNFTMTMIFEEILLDVTINVLFYRQMSSVIFRF